MLSAATSTLSLPFLKDFDNDLEKKQELGMAFYTCSRSLLGYANACAYLHSHRSRKEHKVVIGHDQKP